MPLNARDYTMIHVTKEARRMLRVLSAQTGESLVALVMRLAQEEVAKLEKNGELCPRRRCYPRRTPP